jgi:phosphomannomutase
MSIFTVSGLRGIVGEDLRVSYLQDIGRKFGLLIHGGRCSVGRDTRRSGDMVHQAVVSGLLSTGCSVVDLGVTSTPSVFRTVRSLGLEGGVSVTASHNPPEWNGVKMILAPGRGITQGELDSLAEKQQDQTFGGKIFSMKSQYPEDLLKFIGSDTCRGVKVAIDLGGGAGCGFIEDVLLRLGCKVTGVNQIPGIYLRGLDPTTDDLTDLRKLILQSSSEVGFAFDTDADRLVLIDKEGRKLPPDYTLLAGIKYLVNRFNIKKVAISVDTSLSVVRYLEALDLSVVTSPVGEVNVVNEIVDKACDAGGEGSSGGFVYPSFNLCRDGLLVALMVASLIKEVGGLDEIFRETKAYEQVRRSVPCDRGEYYSIMEKLSSIEVGADRTDGLKISPNSDSWILIRPSNTENSIRISSEAPSASEALKLASRYEELIRDLVQGPSLK